MGRSGLSTKKLSPFPPPIPILCPQPSNCHWFWRATLHLHGDVTWFSRWKLAKLNKWKNTHPKSERKEQQEKTHVQPRDNTWKNVTTQTRATKDNNGDLVKGRKRSTYLLNVSPLLEGCQTRRWVRNLEKHQT